MPVEKPELISIDSTISDTANTTVYSATYDDSTVMFLVDDKSEEITHEFDTQSEAETFASSKE